MTPTACQIEAALFLKDRNRALLASAPRTGKTGSAILGAQLMTPAPKSILIVTTASGRIVWQRGCKTWAPTWPDAIVVDRKLKALDLVAYAPIVIVGWPTIGKPLFLQAATSRRWDLLIVDEAHYAMNPDTIRTQACFGSQADPLKPYLAAAAETIWPLTGTPMAKAPSDMHPMLLRIAPERLAACEASDWPDVTQYSSFRQRYDVVKLSKIRVRGGRFRMVEVTTGGKNLEELKARIAGLFLRRTQEEAGISPPLYELLPLEVPESVRKRVDAETPEGLILQAIEAGDTRRPDIHFSQLRTLTAGMKAEPLAQLIADEIGSGYGKFVVMAWHHATIDLLTCALAHLGAVVVTGATPTTQAAKLIDQFQTDPEIGVLIGQMQAVGEAVDLSAADELIFAEMSTVPKDMQQAALRITNLGKKRPTRVRVAAIAGSVEEAILRVLAERVRTIRAVLG